MYQCFPDKALKILKSATSQANSILTETHPLQGELADATARVYATTGENNSLILYVTCSQHSQKKKITSRGTTAYH